MVVFSLVTLTRLAVPRSSMVVFSRDRPTSSEITVPPVRIAMSCSISLRRSPKPGAFTAFTFTMPRILFTTRVANASPSMSSAIICKGLPALATDSRTGRSSRMLEIFLSTSRMYGSSSSVDMFSWLLMKYGDRKPRSNCMPSTTSSSSSRPRPSSTVITPSLPTFSIASAISWPMVSSPLAEIVPTWAMLRLSSQGLDRSRMACTAAIVALSMPRLRSIGFMPAVTALMPSRTMACARTVAVVVPSPAVSLAWEATSLTIWAPMFSNLSFSSISLATDTPSLVTVGAPKDLSRTTLRPFGPRVTLTASARMLTP
mmetsp:Transcript_6317/g.8162  ORF Transcript_6317/g.8162 Transcript_6317/m.8162 type:complete len:315 (+) Transcript_6317:677-1621(+)